MSTPSTPAAGSETGPVVHRRVSRTPAQPTVRARNGPGSARPARDRARRAVHPRDGGFPAASVPSAPRDGASARTIRDVPVRPAVVVRRGARLRESCRPPATDPARGRCPRTPAAAGNATCRCRYLPGPRPDRHTTVRRRMALSDHSIRGSPRSRHVWRCGRR